MCKPDCSFFLPLLLLSAVQLSACTPEDQPRNPWREEFTVIVVQADRDVDTEFEQQLVTLFAKQMQVKIKLLPLPQNEIIPALLANKGHIAAAGFRSNEIEGIRFGPSYQTVS